MKKLLTILAMVGITAGPVVATVSCSNNSSKNDDSGNDDNVEKHTTSEVIKTTNLGDIIIPKNQKTVSKLNIAKAVVKCNSDVALEDITITGKYTSHNKGTANVHVKGYVEAIQVSFNFGEATSELIKVTNLGEITIPEKQNGASAKDIIKAVIALNPGIKNSDVTITGKKEDNGKGTANVHIKNYINAVQVSFTYCNQYSGDDIKTADVSWSLDAYSTNPNKSIWIPLSKVINNNNQITLDLSDKIWSRIIWTGMLNANDEQALKDFDSKKIWTILHFEGNPSDVISSLISNYINSGNELKVDSVISYDGSSELTMTLDKDLLSQTKGDNATFKTLGLQASTFKLDNLNIKFYNDQV